VVDVGASLAASRVGSKYTTYKVHSSLTLCTAYRDRDAGRDNNRSKPATEEGAPSSHPRGGRGRGRSGGNRREFDRHSGTGKEEHEKQVEHGWGGKTGEKEWSDELAGAELAQKDAAGVDASGADTNANTEGAEGAATTEEEEEKVKTYDDYLAELAARQANLGPRTEVRRPNEGTREDKKWANAKPLPKVEGEGEYFIGESKDKTRNRERKGKQLLDIELRFVDQNKRGGGERGSGRGRGSDRGGRGGRGDRSAPRSDRGNRGGKVSTINVNIDVNIHDSSTFPALGA